MPLERRLSVMVKWPPAMTVTRVSTGNKKLCYVVTVNKIVRYQKGRTKVVYIGGTDEGLDHLVTATAGRASQILASHDITHFDAHVITCKSHGGVATWHKLERAMLLAFTDLYGEKPLCNPFGAGKETDEFKYFARERIINVLEDLG